MAAPLTSIGARRTPSIPIEVTYAPFEGLPLDIRNVLLIGERAAAGGSESAGTLKQVVDFLDAAKAKTEVEGYFGTGAEIAGMAEIFVKTIQDGGVFPLLWVIDMPNGLPDLDPALAAVVNSPFDGIVVPNAWENATETAKLKTHVALVSGPTRTDNQQFGTIGVAASFEGVAATAYAAQTYDSRGLSLAWIRDDAGTRVDTEALIAASYAGRVFANPLPFNPINRKGLVGAVPAAEADWIDQGLSGTAETALLNGITPIASGRDGILRVIRSVLSVTTQLETAGGPLVQTYFDSQDIQVLFYFRRALWTRLSQSDFQNVKASSEKARQLRDAAVQMAMRFESIGMFQKVTELAPLFKIERDAADRSRFNFQMPVNVVPGLHVIAGNVVAGTLFDVLTI